MLSILPSLLLFATAAAFTPGPNNIMMMTSGLNHGIRRSMPHFMGICFGFPTMFLAIGFGLGFVFETYPVIHELIKVLGISYLLYLSWVVANSAPVSSDDGAATKPLTFFQAALFQWINPKAWITGTSALAAFSTGGANIYQEVLFIGFVLFCFTFPSAGAWLFLGRFLKRLIGNHTHQRIFNVTMALLLAASVVPICLELLQKHLG